MSEFHRKSRAFSNLRVVLVLVLMGISITSSFALGSHELVLLVNDESVESILLAQVYQRLRSIPDCNVIRLSIPETVYDGMATDILPENFARYIWEPMQAAIQKAGTKSQILACVFSCGFPTKVMTQPPISLTGATFLKNKIPPSDLIESGRYVSELFSGPANAESKMGTSATFDNERNRLLEDMPFPAMMLAFTGTNGMTLDGAIASLEHSTLGDYSYPHGVFYFLINDDVRSTCRHWEYEAVAAAIRNIPGQSAIISTNLPASTDFPLCGFMTGNRTASTASFEFVPGAYADNLTSYGAAFDRREHTKVTSWLNAGASFSSGSVTEPFALWTKFAHACIFLHSLAGCSAIESVYQSIRCPLQILPVGDPLSKPWAPKNEPFIQRKDGELSGLVEMTASLADERPEVYYRFQWLVDGRAVGTGRTFVWNSRGVKDGRHFVRLVARHQLESVRHQNFTEIGVEVRNGGTK